MRATGSQIITAATLRAGLGPYMLPNSRRCRGRTGFLLDLLQDVAIHRKIRDLMFELGGLLARLPELA